MIFRGLRNIPIIICSSTWSFKAWWQPGYSQKLHNINNRSCLVPHKRMNIRSYPWAMGMEFFFTGSRRKKWQMRKLQSSLPMQNITGVEHRCSNCNVHINLCSVDKGNKWPPLWKCGEVRWQEVVMRSTLSVVASDANRPTFKMPRHSCGAKPREIT